MNDLGSSLNAISCASSKSRVRRSLLQVSYPRPIVAKLLVATLAFGGSFQLRAATPPVISVNDSFEGSHIYPFWTLTETNGSLGPSREQSYAGTHSLKFISASGGDIKISISHQFPAHTKGTVSVAYYDYAPGQQTLYEQLTVADSSNPQVSASVGTMDFDATCYMTNFGTNGGPNANCGSYPQITTTPVVRTVGWHVFTIVYGASYVQVQIDGNVVYVAPGNYSFDTVTINVSGPSWRPNTSAYFDDFRFTPLTF